MKEFFELASYIVTVLGLPCALMIFILEQKKERANEEEEEFQLLSNSYHEFLKVVLDNSDLRLRTHDPKITYTEDQIERIWVIYDMLISLFERAYLVAWKKSMNEEEARRWNSWDDFMHEWCRRDHFVNALPDLLRGEDPEFSAHIRKIAYLEREARNSNS